MGSFILWLTPRDFWKVLCSGAMSFPSVWRVKGLLLTVKEGQMGTGGTLATQDEGRASFAWMEVSCILFQEGSPGRTKALW